jgi:hypothetical protein
MLPLNAFSPAALVLEDISVGVAGSVRDERIFVKWIVGDVILISSGDVILRRFAPQNL